MHLVFSKILKYALQTFLRFDSNVPPQIQNSLLFMVHIHMIYTGFTHFCREISLVAITHFGRHFCGKIQWEEAQKHFIGPGTRVHWNAVDVVLKFCYNYATNDHLQAHLNMIDVLLLGDGGGQSHLAVQASQQLTTCNWSHL